MDVRLSDIKDSSIILGKYFSYGSGKSRTIFAGNSNQNQFSI